MHDELCGVCVGKPLPNGKECVCGGTRTLYGEAQGLRERLLELEIALGSFVNLPPQASKAYTEVCELIENMGYIRKEALIGCLNSVKELHSEKLSSIGIDDFGDLCDEVYVIRELMRKLWSL